MEWDGHSRLLLASFCLELAKNKFKETKEGNIFQTYAWNLYTQIDVEYCYFNNFLLFVYKGQEILKISSSKITHNKEIRISEEEADKANTMIGMIDMLD